MASRGSAIRALQAPAYFPHNPEYLPVQRPTSGYRCTILTFLSSWDGLFRGSINAFGAAMHSHLNPSTPLDPIRLAKMAHSAEATAQKGRASPTDTATSALGGCIVVSGEHVTGTRHVFDTSLETPEGSRNWAINTVDLPADIGDAWLVVGYSGTGSPTGRMVAKVANLISDTPQRMEEMQAIANITLSLIHI